MVIFSNFRLFVLLIALLDNVVLATFSFRPSNSTCVWTERQLRKVIEKASNKTRTRITLCRQLISITNTRNQYNRTGIDLTDRFVDIRCYLKRSKGTCSLDGKSNSRIFYCKRADLTVRNVVFTNAQDDCTNGGAIFVHSSNLTLIGCSFMNNGNKCVLCGGAIHIFQSTLRINGGSNNRPVMFSDNLSDNGAALCVFRSKVSIDGYTIFSKNIGEFGAVEIATSIFNMKNVKFQENVAVVGSAIYSYEANSTMRNVDFIGNVGISVNIYYNSSLLATNCTFANNNGTVIQAELSKITLKNSTFSNNTSNENASNIDIDDDKDPLKAGTFVKCESNVVFCNGLGEDSISEYNSDDTGNDDPLFNETFVKCESNVVFCNALGEDNIDEDSIDNTIGNFSNTDCNSKGLQGTPGQGSCPI